MPEKAVTTLRVQVRAGTEDEFVRTFAALDIFGHARRRAGLRKAELLRPDRPGDPFVVAAEWDSRADYERWLADPLRAELNRELEPFVDGPMAGASHTVALTTEGG
jgi:heme-degrading monooxygenase HmoA